MASSRTQTLAMLNLHLDQADSYLHKLVAVLEQAEVPEEHVEQIKRAYSDGLLWVSRGAAGDARSLEELRIVASRMSLWSWAGAEAARRATVTAWKAWLYGATKLLGEGAWSVFEAGLRTLINAGLEEISKPE